MSSDTPKRTAAFYLWLATTVVTGLATLGVGAMVLMGGEELSNAAKENGQLITVSLADGKVDGKQISSVEPAPLPPTLPEDKTPPVEPAPDHTPEAEPTAPEAEPATPEITPSEGEPAPEPTEPLAPAARIKPNETPEITEAPLPPPEAPVAETTPATATEAAPPPVTPSPVSEVASGKDSLSPVVPGMKEKLESGEEVPIINTKSGMTPWEYYGKPFTAKGEGPRVAILVTGLGHSRASTEAAIKLPQEVTLSFSPYAKDTPVLARNARALGHEVMVDLPMETADYPASDPGPYAMLSILTPQENTSRLIWVLSRFQGFTGVFTPMTEKLTSNATFIAPLWAELKKRGLMMVLGNAENTPPDERSHGVIKAALVVDSELSKSAINEQLKKLEEAARKEGFAIGIGQPYPMSLTLINAWADGLKKRGITLAPVSALIKK